MKKILIGFTLLVSMSSFAKNIADLSGCVISIPLEQDVRSHPKNNLFGTAGKVVFKAYPEETYYVLSAGKSSYSLGLSVEYLRVISTDNINVGGYLSYKTGAYSEGLIDFNIERCGATYGLIEKMD